MTSLVDISKITGFSKATVSRALSGNGYVSKKAEEEIKKVAMELDYTTNAIAQELSNGTTRNIGVVLPHVKHPFFNQILEGILEKSFDSNYKIVILPSKYDMSLELTYLEQFRKKAFYSMIFTSLQVDEKVILKYQKYGQIVLCHKPECSNISASFADRDNGYIEAFKWLKAQKVKKTAFLLSRTKSPTTSVTIQNYERVFQNRVSIDQVFGSITSIKDGYDLAPHLIQFDSIFVNSDEIGASIWHWFDEHNLPKPIIIGQEEMQIGKFINLPTVNNNYHQIGESAFELAISDNCKQVSNKSRFILNRSV